MIDALVLVLILLLTYVVVHLQRENVRFKVGRQKKMKKSGFAEISFCSAKTSPLISLHTGAFPVRLEDVGPAEQ